MKTAAAPSIGLLAPRLGAYFAGIWSCRYFWLSLVQKDLKTRYRRSALGVGWSLLQPIAMSAVLCVVFHQVFQLEIQEYAPFLIAGLSFWSYLSACVLQGCQSIYHGEPYIRQCPAPMAIYPLRTVLGAGFHFLLALGIVLACTWCFRGFGNLAVLWTLAPTLVLLFILGWSLAILAGLANVYFPDAQHLAEVSLQILFYATPIMYPREMLRMNGLTWFFQFNPLAAYVQLLREPIIDAHVPGWEPFVIAAATSLAIGTVAALSMSRLERRLIYQL